jgi:hypothetical protein
VAEQGIRNFGNWYVEARMDIIEGNDKGWTALPYSAPFKSKSFDHSTSTVQNCRFPTSRFKINLQFQRKWLKHALVSPNPTLKAKLQHPRSHGSRHTVEFLPSNRSSLPFRSPLRFDYHRPHLPSNPLQKTILRGHHPLWTCTNTLLHLPNLEYQESCSLW